MSLLRMASHVFAEQGEPGLKRWEARLTWEERAALQGEVDQFGANLTELGPLMKVVADVIQKHVAQLSERVPSDESPSESP